MQQMPLPTIHPGPQLTTFRSGPPPMIGWWLTQIIYPGDTEPKWHPLMRFWRGGEKPADGASRWSQAIDPFASGRLADLAWSLCMIDEAQIQYQGLDAPARNALYPYPLEAKEMTREMVAAWDWEVAAGSQVVDNRAFIISPGERGHVITPRTPAPRVRVDPPPNLGLMTNPVRTRVVVAPPPTSQSTRIRVLTK